MALYQIRDFYPHLKHPEKYKGTRPITMRSGWEIQYAQWLDKHPSVLEWNSESIIIPYISPLDGKPHRYFVDFWMKANTVTGTKEYLIEVKPSAEVMLAESPCPPKRLTKSSIAKIQTAMKNASKWKYARLWCEEERKKGRDIQFVIITERDGFFKI